MAAMPGVRFSAAKTIDSGPDGIMAMVAGDANGDRIPDLVLANSEGSLSVLLGDGQGGFGPVNIVSLNNGKPVPTRKALVAGDWNRDGKLDLAVGDGDNTWLYVFAGDGRGNFTLAQEPPVTTNAVSVATADVNGDLILDLVSVANKHDEVNVLLGDGSGNFAAVKRVPVGIVPTQVVVGDWNSDTKQDLAVLDALNGISLLLGDGLGGFSAAGIIPANRDSGKVWDGPIVVGDANGDGKPDLILQYYDLQAEDTAMIVLLGDGMGGFVTPTKSQLLAGSAAMTVGDFNADGKLDVALRYSMSVQVLLGDGQGGFDADAQWPGDGISVAIVVGDWNGDGKPDLATAVPVSVLLNQTP